MRVNPVIVKDLRGRMRGAGAAVISAAMCLLLAPWLKRWMHEEA